MDLINKQLTPEASVKVVIAEGKIALVALLDTKGMDVSLSAAVDSDYFFDELAKKIPGTIDDAVFALLKGAVKSL